MHTDADEVEAPLVATGPGEVKAKDIDLPSGRRDPQPRGADRDAREENQTRGLPDDRPRPRLLAGRREQVRRAADRRDPDRLDLLADPPRLLLGRRRPRRAADRLRQTRRSTSRPTARSSPAAALREASEILIKSLAIFTDAERVEELTAREPVAGAAGRRALGSPAGDGVASSNGLDEILIEELELGVRSYNCLKRAGVQTVGDLVRKSRAELNAIPNFGSEVDRGSDRDPARPRPRSPAGLRQRRERSGEPDAPPQEAKQAQPRRRASRGAALEPLQAADRARADQDQPGQGQGGQARGREADHAGQTRRPARPPPGAGDAAQRQVHRPQAVRGGGAALRERPGGYTRIVKLGPRRSDSPRWCTSSWFEPRLLHRLDIEYDGSGFAGWAGSRACARSRASWRRRWRRSCASRSR